MQQTNEPTFSVTIPSSVACDGIQVRDIGWQADEIHAWRQICAHVESTGYRGCKVTLTRSQLDDFAADCDYQGWGMDWACAATRDYRALYHKLRALGARRPRVACCPARSEKVR